MHLFAANIAGLVSLRISGFYLACMSDPYKHFITHVPWFAVRVLAVFVIEVIANRIHEWQWRSRCSPGRFDMWWPLVFIVSANFGVVWKI